MFAKVIAVFLLGAAALAGAGLTVIVTDPAGGPLPDARISLRRPDDPVRHEGSLLMRTGKKGEYQLPDLESGRYVVDVWMDENAGRYRFAETSAEFEVPRHEPLRIVVPGTRVFEISGVVVGLEGDLAWGRYLVEAHPIGKDDPEAHPLAAPVNRNGSFALHAVERGRYEIRIARLDVARSSFGPGKPVMEIDVSEDLKGLRVSAR